MLHNMMNLMNSVGKIWGICKGMWDVGCHKLNTIRISFLVGKLMLLLNYGAKPIKKGIAIDKW